MFFFNDTATTEIYTLSLHDALPICGHPRRIGLLRRVGLVRRAAGQRRAVREPSLGRGGLAGLLRRVPRRGGRHRVRSEEHTSELQSRQYLVCRLLLEKKKTPSLSYS